MNNQVITGYAGNPAPTPTRDLQIPLALDELQNSIERMGKLSEELCLRLEKVCRPTPPQPNETPSPQVNPIRAELVENISGKAARVRHVCEMLEGVLQRIEL